MFSPSTGLYLPEDVCALSKELAQQALKPSGLGVLIDRQTADRIFVWFFSDRAPVVIRRTQVEVLQGKILLARAEAAALH